MAIATLVVVLLLCGSGVVAVSLQVRCIDAAREAARLAARGDDTGLGAAARLAPTGASVDVRREGEYLIARVTARSVMLPGLVIGGEAVALAESGT